jgi:hypothetical protein
VEEAGPRYTSARIRRGVAADRAYAAAGGARGRELSRATLDSLLFHVLRAAGSVLGSRADRLPAAVRRRCSLEGRAGFEPVEPLRHPGQPARAA